MQYNIFISPDQKTPHDCEENWVPILLAALASSSSSNVIMFKKKRYFVSRMYADLEYSVTNFVLEPTNL